MRENLRSSGKTEEDPKIEAARFYLKAFECRTRGEAKAWLREERKLKEARHENQ